MQVHTIMVSFQIYVTHDVLKRSICERIKFFFMGQTHYCDCFGRGHHRKVTKQKHFLSFTLESETKKLIWSTGALQNEQHPYYHHHHHHHLRFRLNNKTRQQQLLWLFLRKCLIRQANFDQRQHQTDCKQCCML